jgi:hypothetical protein
MVHKWHATFFLQETDSVNSKTPTWPTYHESSKGHIQRSQGPQVQEFTLHKCPPVPYVPKKDCIQGTVSTLKAESLKTQIGKGAELRVPIWHSGMCKAFLLYVGSGLDAIKKK